jgi:hypothetical protein
VRQQVDAARRTADTAPVITQDAFSEPFQEVIERTP